MLTAESLLDLKKARPISSWAEVSTYQGQTESMLTHPLNLTQRKRENTDLCSFQPCRIMKLSGPHLYHFLLSGCSTFWASRRGLNTGRQRKKVKLANTKINTSGSRHWLKSSPTLDALHKHGFFFVFLFFFCIQHSKMIFCCCVAEFIITTHLSYCASQRSP